MSRCRFCVMPKSHHSAMQRFPYQTTRLATPFGCLSKKVAVSIWKTICLRPWSTFRSGKQLFPAATPIFFSKVQVFGNSERFRKWNFQYLLRPRRLRNGNSAIGVAQTVYGMEIPQSASPRPFTEWKFRNQRRPGRLRNGNSAISVAQSVYGMETPQSASPRPFTEWKLR
ncbi:MAG: hypothetical protein JWM68_3887, partial [Verrucomicrobiales bacterium]|nr:hypothetical protein [Verrucomicrobiales bacterium]